MIRTNSVDDVVLSLAEAPIDPRTGNRVIYAASWIADVDSMIGKRNEDWVRRELAWFNRGSRSLDAMEPPVPQAFQMCAGPDGVVNSAYGHILFHPDAVPTGHTRGTLYKRIIDTFLAEGPSTRHAVAIISDRDIHTLATHHGRRDFICTNALNIMIDVDNRVHLIAQMRSMDAVWGYRADYSMWDDLLEGIVNDLRLADSSWFLVERGDIIFQVANLHVYPRHFDLLAETAADIQDRLDRQVWLPSPFDAARAQLLADEKLEAQEDGE